MDQPGFNKPYIDKVRMFASGIEDEAHEQVMQTASLPFVRGVAVMPDVHYGKGSTVGTVVATKGAIMPACVGVDIGCGMIAVRTALKPGQVLPHLKAIREGIERRIPLGIGPHGMNTTYTPSAERRIAELEDEARISFGFTGWMSTRSKDWREQLGSLGGGNHFIEVCVGRSLDHNEMAAGTDDEEVWVILHSGSRGVGNKTGTFWTNDALNTAKKYMYDSYLPNPDLAYLVTGSEAFFKYMEELRWCQEYARLNREEMMDRVLIELTYTLLQLSTNDAYALELERINCHHNYVSLENHGGENVFITRKGAVLASVGTRSLIPGSMGSASYICTGLGHPGAYNSAPHGAGRRMSRRAAREQFTVESVRAEMAARGVEARIREAIIDEAPGAYKDINLVMYDARALVKPTHILRQIISVKGD